MNRGTIAQTLLSLMSELGLSEDAFAEMSIGEVLSRLNGHGPYVSRKWTRGEIGQIVADGDDRAALEVLQYLNERGPRVVAWDDDTVTDADEMSDTDVDNLLTVSASATATTKGTR